MANQRATRTARTKGLAPIPLPGDLAQDLEAFCAAHYKAEKAEIIREALRFFIDTRLAEEPIMKARFLEERAMLIKRPGTVVPLKAYELREPKAYEAREPQPVSDDEPKGVR